MAFKRLCQASAPTRSNFHRLANASIVACDAYMLPASPFPHQPRSVTFATVTASTSLVGSVSFLGLNASILHMVKFMP